MLSNYDILQYTMHMIINLCMHFLVAFLSIMVYEIKRDGWEALMYHPTETSRLVVVSSFQIAFGTWLMFRVADLFFSLE
jgi:hypothetical protein